MLQRSVSISCEKAPAPFWDQIWESLSLQEEAATGTTKSMFKSKAKSAMFAGEAEAKASFLLQNLSRES